MLTGNTLAYRRGFTLIELLIVIVVIATLALIVLPRVMGAGRKAREATLRANLSQLRRAIQQFESDTGLYPAALIDLTKVKANAPTTGIDEADSSQAIPSGTYAGPYLNSQGGIGVTGIPVNPFKSPQDADYLEESAHWNYGTDGPGSVHPAIPITGSTVDGIPYSAL